MLETAELCSCSVSSIQPRLHPTQHFVDRTERIDSVDNVDNVDIVDSIDSVNSVDCLDSSDSKIV